MYFLNINKPKGLSSFDVIRKLRKKLLIKKIGHSGTLDPLASGVLQIGVGECTKLLEYLPSDKTYVAKIKFGYTTDTYDDEGEKKFVKVPDFELLQLNAVLHSFLGKTMQIPPKYSAIKFSGKKSCDIVRKNKFVDFELNAREVEIFFINLISFNSDYTAEIFVHCAKGTYIRSLVFDIGEKLGCGAYVVDLKRIAAGSFKIEDSDLAESLNFKCINPLDVLPFCKYELNDFEYNKIINGNFIKIAHIINSDKVLLTKNNKLVSLANLSDNLVKPIKVFRG